MKSQKQLFLDTHLLDALVPKDGTDANEYLPYKVTEMLITDPEIAAQQEYANNVSIQRLGFNDHGPVHMRTVARNAITMKQILQQNNIKTCLETETVGTFEDSLTAVILAGFLHDLGMSIGRQDHEFYSVTLAMPIIERILQQVLPGMEHLEQRTIIRSLAMEGIAGHMGTHRIHSLEAGLILIADGCDMTKGRARIPMAINTDPKQGDIHKYSANSIEKVHISSGEIHPIRIEIQMSSPVGFFQIEEVLIPKINASPAKPYIELYAGVTGEEVKKYL